MKILATLTLALCFSLISYGQKKYEDFLYNTDGILFYEDFSANFNGWPIVKAANRTFDIKDGIYEIKGISDNYNPMLILNNQSEYFEIDESRDFQIEMEMKLSGGAATSPHTLNFGQNKVGSNIRFGISQNGQFLVTKYENQKFTNLVE